MEGGLLKDNVTPIAVKPDLFVSRNGENTATGLSDLVNGLRDRAATVLLSLPLSHLRGQTLIRGMLRDKSIAEYPSCYDFNSKVIEFRVPLKMTQKFLSMNKGDADDIYTRIATNRSPDKASFWATAPTGRTALTDNLFDWVVRHEFGHSIDDLILFSNRFAWRPEFGGWARYRPNFAEDLIMDLLLDAGATAEVAAAILRGDIKQRIIDALTTEHGTKWSSQSFANRHLQRIHWPKSDWQRARQGHGPTAATLSDEKLAEATQGDATQLQLLKRICAVLDVATDDAWLDGDSAANRIGERRYHYCGQYQEWYSYSALSFSHRISNYQFSAPAEWFAETYAAVFGTGTEMQREHNGSLANYDIVDWFQRELHPENSARHLGAPTAGLYSVTGNRAELKSAPNRRVRMGVEALVPSCWEGRNLESRKASLLQLCMGLEALTKDGLNYLQGLSAAQAWDLREYISVHMALPPDFPRPPSPVTAASPAAP